MNIRLTSIQFFMVLFIILTGFVYVSFQSYIIENGKRASWLIFIIVSIIIYLILIVYEKTYKYFVLGKVFSFIYLVYGCIHISISIGYVVYIISTWLAPNTPSYVLLLMLLIPSLYASLSRPETTINLGVPFSGFIIIFIVFLLNGSKEFFLTNLFPLEEGGMKGWMWGAIYSFNAFRNLECYLFLRRYVMKNQKISGLPLFLFFLALFFMYFFSIIIVMMYFSLNEFKVVSEPILYLLHAQEVTFAKRLDLIFIFVWILISILTLTNYILVARIIRFQQQKNLKRQKIEIVAIHMFIFVGGYLLFPYERNEMVTSNQWISFFIFGFGLPILIIIWNKIRGRTIFDSSN